jgi:hypothetical protein
MSEAVPKAGSVRFFETKNTDFTSSPDGMHTGVFFCPKIGAELVLGLCSNYGATWT